MLEARLPMPRPSELRFERFRATVLVAINQAACAAALWLDQPLACRLVTLVAEAIRLVRRFASALRLGKTLARAAEAFAASSTPDRGMHPSVRGRHGGWSVRVLAFANRLKKTGLRSRGATTEYTARPIRTSQSRLAPAGCA